MGAFDVLSALQRMGLRLSASGESIRAEPKAALTEEARHLIRTHKAELLATLTQPELATVAEDCAEFYNERAAIMEYDGGLSREDAEAAAREATERHRLECWNRFQRRAAAILSLPTWEGRLKAIERHRQEHGENAGQEMMGWVRHKSGLGVE